MDGYSRGINVENSKKPFILMTLQTCVAISVQQTLRRRPGKFKKKKDGHSNTNRWCQILLSNCCSKLSYTLFPGTLSLTSWPIVSTEKQNKLKIGNNLQQLMDRQISVQPYGGPLLYKRKKKVTDVHSIKINLKRIY